MNFKEIEVLMLGNSIAEYDIFKKFMKKWHYSKSIPGGTTNIFMFKYKKEIIGGAIIGIPVSNKCAKKYTKTGKLLELRRFCLIDQTPKNTESYLIGYILRWFQKNTEIEAMLSYADPEYGHEGIIYKATNFKYLGRSKFPQYCIEFSGKKYHLRQVWQKGTHLSDWILGALKYKFAKYVKLEKKHIYLYQFNRNYQIKKVA